MDRENFRRHQVVRNARFAVLVLMIVSGSFDGAILYGMDLSLATGDKMGVIAIMKIEIQCDMRGEDLEKTCEVCREVDVRSPDSYELGNMRLTWKSFISFVYGCYLLIIEGNLA